MTVKRHRRCAPCWTSVPERHALWVTLEESIPAGTQVNVIVHYLSTHSAVNSPNTSPSSLGLGGAIVRFSTSAQP